MGFEVVFASCLFIPMLVAGKLRERVCFRSACSGPYLQPSSNRDDTWNKCIYTLESRGVYHGNWGRSWTLKGLQFAEWNLFRSLMKRRLTACSTGRS